MTQEEIAKMAREAGASQYTNRHFLDRPFNTFSPEALERFVYLVTAAEREACAKVAENFGPSRPIISITPSQTIRGRWEGEQAASSGIATAIREQA